jgi:hypothetical protein
VFTTCRVLFCDESESILLQLINNAPKINMFGFETPPALQASQAFLQISMSGILDDANNAHSTTPPRKRSRQDSACDPEPSPPSSDGGGESGSSVNGGSMENDDREDDRRAGSQKRARSEGLGESDNARGSVSWSRGSHPLPLPSAETARHFGGRTTSEHSSVNSLIPFPVAPRCEVETEPEGSNSSRQGGSTSSSLVYTAQNDLARTMAFDQQIDALRRSPPPISLSPSLASQTASAGDSLSTCRPCVLY